jgi:hypothetical protein
MSRFKRASESTGSVPPTLAPSLSRGLVLKIDGLRELFAHSFEAEQLGEVECLDLAYGSPPCCPVKTTRPSFHKQRGKKLEDNPRLAISDYWKRGIMISIPSPLSRLTRGIAMADLTALSEIEKRIQIVEDNLRQLQEQAAAYSGAADEERNAQRIADQEAKLAALLKQRDVLMGKG